MKKLVVAFDVDDTLITWNESGRAVPNHEVIELLRWFYRHGHEVRVWSGGGLDYAQQWAEKLNLDAGLMPNFQVIVKGSVLADIAVDDLGIRGFPAVLEDGTSIADGQTLGKVVIVV